MPNTALPATRHLFSRLQREWDALARSPRAIARARAWGLPVGEFADLADLLRLAGYGRRGLGVGTHDDDGPLGALVRVARHDDLAARVVLQRLMPGLAAMSRRWSRWDGVPSDDPDFVLGVAWGVIREYPVDERPQYVAASLLRMVEYRAYRRDQRRVDRTVAVGDERLHAVAAPPDHVEPADELAALLDEARVAGLGPSDLELARRLGRGESCATLAAEQRVTDRTIRNHRAAVVHRLRQVALAG